MARLITGAKNPTVLYVRLVMADYFLIFITKSGVSLTLVEATLR